MSDFCDLRCLPVRKNRRLHTTESSVILTKPKNHSNSVLLTFILGNSDVRRPYYASFPPKRRFVTFLPSEITHSCHQRPTFQILQSRSSAGPPTATLPPSLILQACPLIGQSSSWRTTAMAPTRVGYTSKGPHPGRACANAAFAPSLPMGWCRHSLSTPNQSYRKLAVFTIARIFPAKSWIGERILTL